MFLLVLGRLLILLRPNSLRPNFLTPQPRFEFHFRRRVSIGRRQESAGNMTRQDAPDCRHAIRTPYYLQQGREIEGPEAPERPTGRIQLRIRVCGLSVNQLGLAPFAINPCLIWGYVNAVGCTGCAKARNFHRQYATSSAGLSPSACYVRIPPRGCQAISLSACTRSEAHHSGCGVELKAVASLLQPHAHRWCFGTKGTAKRVSSPLSLLA